MTPATIVLYLGDLQKSSEEPLGFQATLEGVVQFEGSKKVPCCKKIKIKNTSTTNRLTTTPKTPVLETQYFPL